MKVIRREETVTTLGLTDIIIREIMFARSRNFIRYDLMIYLTYILHLTLTNFQSLIDQNNK